MAESRARQTQPGNQGDASPANEKDSIRSNILSAGLRLFVERGYSRTTMADICKAAGVSNTVLCRQFKTKEVIFRTLYEDFHHSLEHSFTALQQEVKGTAERLHAAIEFFFHLARCSPDGISFIFRINHAHVVGDLAAMPDSPAFAILNRFISEGIRSGHIRRIDERLAASLFWGAVEQTLVTYVADPRLAADGMSLDRVINQTWRSAWRMIAQNPT